VTAETVVLLHWCLMPTVLLLVFDSLYDLSAEKLRLLGVLHHQQTPAVVGVPALAGPGLGPARNHGFEQVGGSVGGPGPDESCG
jgi:hypothetical protein